MSGRLALQEVLGAGGPRHGHCFWHERRQPGTRPGTAPSPGAPRPATPSPCACTAPSAGGGVTVRPPRAAASSTWPSSRPANPQSERVPVMRHPVGRPLEQPFQARCHPHFTDGDTEAQCVTCPVSQWGGNGWDCNPVTVSGTPVAARMGGVRERAAVQVWLGKGLQVGAQPRARLACGVSYSVLCNRERPGAAQPGLWLPPPLGTPVRRALGDGFRS